MARHHFPVVFAQGANKDTPQNHLGHTKLRLPHLHPRHQSTLSPRKQTSSTDAKTFAQNARISGLRAVADERIPFDFQVHCKSEINLFFPSGGNQIRPQQPQKRVKPETHKDHKTCKATKHVKTAQDRDPKRDKGAAMYGTHIMYNPLCFPALFSQLPLSLHERQFDL